MSDVQLSWRAGTFPVIATAKVRAGIIDECRRVYTILPNGRGFYAQGFKKGPGFEHGLTYGLGTSPTPDGAKEHCENDARGLK